MLDPLRALGEHQGAPRLLDRAVRRRRRRWSCRPSTSRSTSARCRLPSRPCSTSTTRPGDAWILNDPFARRHAPAGHHGHHAGRSPTAASSSASPPSARTTPTSAASTPGSMPADSHDARRRGRRDPAARARRGRRSTSSSRRCASPTSAAPTCAPSSPLTARARLRLRELAERVGARHAARRRWRRCSTTPSAARAPASRSCPTASARASDVLEARRGRPAS